MNRIEDPGKNSHTYGHLIFEKGARNTQWKNRQHFYQMLLDQLEVCMQKNANRPILISLYKAQVQLDQGSTHKTRHIEEENEGTNLEHMGRGEIS